MNVTNDTFDEGIAGDDRFLLMGQMFQSPLLLAINELTHERRRRLRVRSRPVQLVSASRFESCVALSG